MNNQKPKDCICGFPVQSKTNHQPYCPAHKRITANREKKAEEHSYWEGIWAKEAYGKWMVGVGPKLEDIKDE